jgi:hypothetical protein
LGTFFNLHSSTADDLGLPVSAAPAAAHELVFVKLEVVFGKHLVVRLG